MNLYETLVKNQANVIKHFESEDYLFYNENRYLLNNIPLYRFLNIPKNDFDVIRANIILRAILNKKDLDKAISFAYGSSTMKTDEARIYITERMVNHPYLLQNNNRIYIPIFSKAINVLYYKDFGKLLKSPYNKLLTDYAASCIDIFEAYNFSLYNSSFTKLVTIYQNKDILVAYHYDFKTLYFINNQGRLDAQIALFDKYMKKIVDNHIMERTKGVIEAYLNDDRETMYKELIKNNLISEKLIYKIKSKEYKFHHKKESKII